MVMRMVPTDFLGIDMFTALTTFAALTVPPRRTDSLRICTDTLATVSNCGAVVLVLVVVPFGTAVLVVVVLSCVTG